MYLIWQTNTFYLLNINTEYYWREESTLVHIPTCQLLTSIVLRTSRKYKKDLPASALYFERIGHMIWNRQDCKLRNFRMVPLHSKLFIQLSSLPASLHCYICPYYSLNIIFSVSITHIFCFLISVSLFFSHCGILLFISYYILLIFQHSLCCFYLSHFSALLMMCLSFSHTIWHFLVCLFHSCLFTMLSASCSHMASSHTHLCFIFHSINLFLFSFFFTHMVSFFQNLVSCFLFICDTLMLPTYWFLCMSSVSYLNYKQNLHDPFSLFWLKFYFLFHIFYHSISLLTPYFMSPPS